MHRKLTIGAVLTVLAAGAACQDRTTDVEQQTRELREARGQSPQVVKELETELQRAKDEVVQLERKLTLARQGITDEVLSERKELENTLKSQGQRVQTEIGEAKREAAQHNEDMRGATQALQETKPPQVEAEVQSSSRVEPSEQRTRETTTQRQELIPVSGRERVAVDAGTDPDTDPGADPTGR